MTTPVGIPLSRKGRKGRKGHKVGQRREQASVDVLLDTNDEAYVKLKPPGAPRKMRQRDKEYGEQEWEEWRIKIQEFQVECYENKIKMSKQLIKMWEEQIKDARLDLFRCKRELKIEKEKLHEMYERMNGPHVHVSSSTAKKGTAKAPSASDTAHSRMDGRFNDGKNKNKKPAVLPRRSHPHDAKLKGAAKATVANRSDDYDEDKKPAARPHPHNAKPKGATKVTAANRSDDDGSNKKPAARPHRHDAKPKGSTKVTVVNCSDDYDKDKKPVTRPRHHNAKAPPMQSSKPKAPPMLSSAKAPSTYMVGKHVLVIRKNNPHFDRTGKIIDICDETDRLLVKLGGTAEPAVWYKKTSFKVFDN